MDLGASNHMKNHEEWFMTLKKPEQPGFVETVDDTVHTIEHIGYLPLSHVVQRGCMKNSLNMPTITKTLVSV